MKYSGITHLFLVRRGLPKEFTESQTGRALGSEKGKQKVRRASISAGITQRLEETELGSEKGRSSCFLLLAPSSYLQFLAPIGKEEIFL